MITPPGGLTIQYESGLRSMAATSASLSSGIVKESDRKSKWLRPYFCCIFWQEIVKDNNQFNPSLKLTLKCCQSLSFLAIWWQEGKGEILTWKCSSMKTLASACCWVKKPWAGLELEQSPVSPSNTRLRGLKMPRLVTGFLSLSPGGGGIFGWTHSRIKDQESSSMDQEDKMD